jgi:hypothetical protein
MDTLDLERSVDLSVGSMRSGKMETVFVRMGMQKLMEFVVNAPHTPEYPLISNHASVKNTSTGIQK